MRRFLIAGLMVWGMLTLGVAGSTAAAADLPVPAGGFVRPDYPAWEVEGFGKTAEAAREDALKQAREKVVEHLSQKYGSPVLLREDTLQRMTQEVGPPKEEELPVSGLVMKVTLTVQVKPEHVQEWQQQARELRMGERQRVAGLGLGGVVVLLLVVVGYLRLEDATKGYYTTWLRLAAASVLGLVGVCLYRLS